LRIPAGPRRYWIEIRTHRPSGGTQTKPGPSVESFGGSQTRVGDPKLGADETEQRTRSNDVMQRKCETVFRPEIVISVARVGDEYGDNG
jgi:hypothetical protein